MVDITKFQNFVFTLVLVVAYAAAAIKVIHEAKTAGAVTAVPGFSGTFLTLLGISHAGYTLGKVPDKVGEPEGLTVANRATVTAAAEAAAPGPDFRPRNRVA